MVWGSNRRAPAVLGVALLALLMLAGGPAFSQDDHVGGARTLSGQTVSHPGSVRDSLAEGAGERVHQVPVSETGHAADSEAGHGEAEGHHADPSELADDLMKFLDTQTSVTPSQNELIIHYDKAEDLDRIYSKILGKKVSANAEAVEADLAAKFNLYAEKVEVTSPDSGSPHILIRYNSADDLKKIFDYLVSWKPPLWSVTGFVLMLLSIAVIPLVNPHWWEHNKNRAIVSAILGVPLAIYVIMNDWSALALSLHEYEQFLILLGSLFVISGGIWLTGDVKATPKNNAIFIAIGTLLASFIGTTGAAMLLIRPLLTTNRERKYVAHTVIFFIFLVANIGGSLTPLGDPPLFLGYLKGVPFVWTFNLWKLWLPAALWLLCIYFILDSYIYKNKETDEAKKWDDTDLQPIRLRGAHNFLFLLGVVLSIYFYPNMLHYMVEKFHLSEHTAEFIPVRECLMILMAVLSWTTTKMEYRKAQNFTWGPILEVAILFAAIFVTMIPALIILRHWGPTSPIREPWHFFWVTGALSSFLDNAPTYLVFLSLGEGQGAAEGISAITLNSGGKVKELTLLAISAGAVFMGANTYIGNAPNFMVKSIAEENKIKMPSFFGYMAWSVGILIPTFIIITLIFFR